MTDSTDAQDGSMQRLLPKMEKPGKAERPAAAKFVREGGHWYLRVRRSMHREGRAATIANRQGQLILGPMHAEYLMVEDLLDSEFVLSTFTDPNPRPPRSASRRNASSKSGGTLRPVRRDSAGQVLASDAQVRYVERLWEQNGGGRYCQTDSLTLEAPTRWADLTREQISWYIDTLIEDAF